MIGVPVLLVEGSPLGDPVSHLLPLVLCVGVLLLRLLLALALTLVLKFAERTSISRSHELLGLRQFRRLSVPI